MKTAAFFDVLSRGFRLIGGLVRLWPVAIIAWFLLIPATPHIRWTYQYIPNGSQKHFTHCTYLGTSGLVSPDFPPDCPFFAIINPDHWR